MFIKNLISRCKFIFGIFGIIACCLPANASILETIRAEYAENKLQHEISTEELERKVADTLLDTKIESETYGRKIADALLDTKINTETIRAEYAENKLQHEISTEELERKIADAMLDTKIHTVNNKFYSGKEDVNFKSIKLGKNTVSSIDTGETAITEGNSQQIATTATVMKSAENATYTGSTGENVISSQPQTINTAINTLDKAIGNMDFSQTYYVSDSENITSAINKLDTGLANVEADVRNLDHRVDHVEKHLRGGIAATAALTALVPNARDCGNTQISIGSGNYADKVGFAAGLFHYINDRVLVNAGGSFATSNDWAFRAGITFGL